VSLGRDEWRHYDVIQWLVSLGRYEWRHYDVIQWLLSLWRDEWRHYDVIQWLVSLGRDEWRHYDVIQWLVSLGRDDWRHYDVIQWLVSLGRDEWRHNDLIQWLVIPFGDLGGANQAISRPFQKVSNWYRSTLLTRRTIPHLCRPFFFLPFDTSIHGMPPSLSVSQTGHVFLVYVSAHPGRLNPFLYYYLLHTWYVTPISL
jgi:hypothetical protein